MPYEPPSGDYRHRRFRVGGVNAWLEERAAGRLAEEGEGAADPGVEQLASALAEAASAADGGNQSKLADALRAVANAAERLADALERARYSTPS